MTVTTFEATETQQPPKGKLNAWLRLSQLWHVILSIAALAGILYIWLVLGDQMALWLRSPDHRHPCGSGCLQRHDRRLYQSS